MLIKGTQFFFEIKVIIMTKNYDESVERNDNLNWPYMPDHPYKILIIQVQVKPMYY